ncbi:hypothetical protein J6590_078900 [Homalodisca vitripennis]|nr:hypothetical protein J6590_078900 [Homalodisca vitripennis]
MGKVRGWGPPPIKIHEKELGHYISKSCVPGRRGCQLLNQHLQSKQAGGGIPLLRLARISDRISTFAVSNVPLLDIHYDCPDLSDTSVFAVSSGRFNWKDTVTDEHRTDRPVEVSTPLLEG